MSGENVEDIPMELESKNEDPKPNTSVDDHQLKDFHGLGFDLMNELWAYEVRSSR